MKLAIVFLSSLSTAMAACGSAGFKVSGSDTVEPVALAWLTPYSKQCPKATPITITAGGSSQGAKDVCGGVSDVGMMSREFKDTEAKGTNGSFTCVTGGKKVTQIAVASDGIIFVAKKGGNAAKCITLLVNTFRFVVFVVFWGSSWSICANIMLLSLFPTHTVLIYIGRTHHR